MTTLVDARESIYTRFVANWTATALGQVILDNEDDKDIDNQALSWVRVSVRETGGGRENIAPAGQRKYRRAGSVFVQCFTPINEGMAEAGTLAEEARTIFEGTSFSDLDFNDGIVRNLGPDDQWQMSVMEADFRFTDTK